MSLRKSPTLTPALLASNRQNAKRSTGPRTARGKAQSRLNALRDGTRSREFMDFYMAVFSAPAGPAHVARVARTLLASKPIQHPMFVRAAESLIQAEIELCGVDGRRFRQAK
jgi:hypothetical protein